MNLICLDLNGVFKGKTCRGLHVIGVNFHICWKRACVKDLTNIMSAVTVSVISIELKSVENLFYCKTCLYAFSFEWLTVIACLI